MPCSDFFRTSKTILVDGTIPLARKRATIGLRDFLLPELIKIVAEYDPEPQYFWESSYQATKRVVLEKKTEQLVRRNERERAEWLAETLTQLDAINEELRTRLESQKDAAT